MYIHDLHPWNLTAAEAMHLQEQLRSQVIVENRLGDVGTVAGVDVAVKGGAARAAVVVLCYPELALLEVARAERNGIPLPDSGGTLAQLGEERVQETGRH
jgi:deoxyinosine 3'endonuclease (endonuclease V)